MIFCTLSIRTDPESQRFDGIRSKVLRRHQEQLGWSLSRSSRGSELCQGELSYRREENGDARCLLRWIHGELDSGAASILSLFDSCR